MKKKNYTIEDIYKEVKTNLNSLGSEFNICRHLSCVKCPLMKQSFLGQVNEAYCFLGVINIQKLIKNFPSLILKDNK